MLIPLRMMCCSLLLGCAALAQTTDYGIDLGYRDVGLTGNENVFRTQLDEDSGMLLRDFYLNIADGEGKVFNLLRLDASGFGGSPHGRLKLVMRKAEVYRLDLSYRRYEHFNLLPAYANPLLESGVTPGQHGLDRTREHLDLKIRFRPGSRLQPLVGISINDAEGPAHTTFTIGGDEFRLDSHSDEEAMAWFAGLAFQSEKWYGELVTGRREFEGRENHVLSADGGEGNSTRTLFGEPINLNDLSRLEQVESEAPTTRFHLAGQPHEQLRVLASYIQADMETEASGGESLTGNLVDFRLRGVFGGRTAQFQSEADKRNQRGDLRLEYRPLPQLGLDASVLRRDAEMDGLAMLSNLFVDVVTFGGNPTADFAEVIEANNRWEREETTYDGRATWYPRADLGFWVGFANADHTSRIEAADAEILVPLGQEGVFERQVETTSLGAYWKHKIVRLNASWNNQDADHMIFRSDFLSRDHLKLKANVKAGKYLNFNAHYQRAAYDNNTDQIELDGTDETLDLGADLQLKRFHAHLGYGTYELDNRIQIRVPQTFQYETSTHLEDGSSYEVLLNVTYKKHDLSLDVTHHENEGALPFEMDLARLSARFRINDNLRITLEGSVLEYREIQLPIADYDADTYGLFFAWSPSPK